MAFTIRQATADDLPEMLRLWREMMDFHADRDPRFRPKPSPEAEEAWANYLREDIFGHDSWCVLVAQEDGKLLGQILGELREPAPVFQPESYGYVTDIVVDPEARRAGVGRTMFDALREWMVDHGASYLRLQVLCSNEASQAFWRSVGCTDHSDILWYDLEAA
jgi:ribosomal protein S18 acetylase RimI-like enzyme